MISRIHFLPVPVSLHFGLIFGYSQYPVSGRIPYIKKGRIIEIFIFMFLSSLCSTLYGDVSVEIEKYEGNA
jgi:hypothetical protein